MTESRIKKSKCNIGFGFVGKIVQLLLKFILRTAVIHFFGAVYLGLDGLFLNVLSVLSIAELGIGNAICFALYKPFAENDIKKVSSYMQLYKKIYKILGAIILVIGLVCIPFLHIVVNFDSSIQVNYYAIYVAFLLNTVLSYWFGAYYQSLFIADQREYIVNNVKNVVFAVTVTLQVVGIYLSRSYYCYLVIMIAGNVITNLLFAHYANKEYPVMKEKQTDSSLTKTELHSLKKNVFALSLTKISTIIYTSSDNIVISAFIGTISVGYYSNYAYVVSAVTGIISIVFSGLLASVGNANASESPEKMTFLFKKILYLNSLIYGICFIFLMQLFQDFMLLWAGKPYLLDNMTVYIIGLMFLFPGLSHSCTIFKDACGLFWETRYRTIATAIVNITLSIILAPRIGLPGIFGATIVSYLTTTFLVDPKIVCTKVLKQPATLFYVWYGKSLLSAVAINALLSVSIGRFQATTWFGFAIKAVLCGAIVAAAYVLLTFKNESFVYYKDLVKNEFSKK